jgi:hypothetical protein
MTSILVATVTGTYTSGVTGVPSLTTTPAAVDVTLLAALVTAAATASTPLIVGSQDAGSKHVFMPTAAAPTGTWTVGDTASGGGIEFKCVGPSTWVSSSSGGPEPAGLSAATKILLASSYAPLSGVGSAVTS